jgi:Kdo2-lipid IVA lauroyltransferase/acyltransferase
MIVDRRALAHRVEYLLTRGVEEAVTALPQGLSDRLGAGIGSLVQSPLGIRRDVVLANLRRAFPDAPEAWIRRTARGAYRHLGRETAATMRLGKLSRAEVIEHSEMLGWDDFRATVDEGRGVILTTGHFGNWEMGAAAIAGRGVPLSAIAQRQSNLLVDARLNANRRRLGVATIERGEASRLVPQALRAGRAVGLVSDQDAGRAGVWVPFFGVPSSTARGPALFALRHGAPVFTIAAFRLPGELRYRVVLERVPVQRTGTLGDDILRLTAELSLRLENAVRLAPEQYFWFHKRWKTPPPKEPSPSPAGTTRMATEVAQRQDGPD